MRFNWKNHSRMLLMSLFLSQLWACSGQQQQEAELQLEQQMSQQGDQEDGQMETSDQENAQQNQQGYDEEENEEALSLDDNNAAEGDYGDQYAEESYNSANSNDLESLIDEGNVSADDTESDSELIANAMENGSDESSLNSLESMDSFENEVSTDSAPTDGNAMMEAEQSQPVAQLGEGLPELGSKMSYIVQRGDTLSMIAQQIYGDLDKWREMNTLTGLENPNRIYPGDVVYYQLTEATMAYATAYENTPKSEVTVNAGDTLAKIARNIYGDPGQWKSIWRQNDQVDNPDRLEVGQVIYFLNYQEVMAQKEMIESLDQASVIAEFSNQSSEVPSVNNLEKEVVMLEGLTMLDNVTDRLSDNA